MSKKKKEHVAIAVFSDGYFYGASEPMLYSECLDVVAEGFKSGVDGRVIDLNCLFEGKPCFFCFAFDEA